MEDVELFIKLNGKLYQLVQVAEEKKNVRAVRNCLQCGRGFVPARKHHKFCTVNCRVAAYRERLANDA